MSIFFISLSLLYCETHILVFASNPSPVTQFKPHLGEYLAFGNSVLGTMKYIGSLE
jgi:hypothetical protein